MAQWLPNLVALGLASLLTASFALAAAWRIGAWHLPQVELLNTDEGLPIGSRGPQIAVHGSTFDADLSFEGQTTFLVFGLEGCEPCARLLEAGASHPALRHMRRIYVSDSNQPNADPEALERWEVYRFHNERAARAQWRAPVNPYFHVVGPEGRVVDKGVASSAEHLDYLLSLKPAGVIDVTALPHSNERRVDARP